ncbi:MAG: FAD-dependent oxidoreductase [Thermoplasmatota archaeon]
MKEADVVIIGGSAAGIPAGITARRHYPDKSIALIRKEEQVLIPCGIPYIFGTVEKPENNLIPDKVLEANDIDLMMDEVTDIDRENKKVNLKSGEEVSYDKLVLATGANPIEPPIPGLDKENVFSVVKDVDYIHSMLDAMDDAENVVILGGGFIGVEFADECNKRGLDLTIVEMLPHCLMLAFAEDFCKEAEEKLKERGVNIVTDSKLEEVLGDEKVEKVKLSDGKEIDADILVVGIGVTANTELGKEAGLDTDKGGYIVDSYMRTTDPNIFACGDCTSKRSFFTGKPTGVNLASVATMESRIVGANLFESKRENPGVVSAFSTAIGEFTMAMAGLNEKQAKDEGFDIAIGEAEKMNRHPGGMPGGHPMKVQLIFNKSNQILIGGQVRGGPSAGELVNVISACIQKKMTADDIATFQMATHPAVTASPVAYQLVNAAEIALQNMC